MVAGNIVTTRPIYLAPISLRKKKKEVAGTDLLGRLIYLGCSQICNLCSCEDAVSHGSLRFACEPGQQAETAGLISVLLTC